MKSYLRLPKCRKHTVGVKGIRVSVVKSSVGGKRSSSRVSVAVVLSAWAVDGRSVSLRVKNSSSLVLSVACAAKGRKVAEEQRAVSDVVVRGKSVGEDIGAAGAVNVSAVGASLTAGGGGAVGGDSAQAGSNSATSGRRGGLEVGLEGGSGSRGGSSGRGGCEPVAVAQSSTDGAELGASAVTLDSGALGEG